jgi:hypothetical protein
MRYLRSFNEDNSAGLTEDEIRDFCEINLAYLIDDGMKIVVDEYHNASVHFCVMLSFKEIGGIKWIAIKDQVIPFLNRLRNEYKLATLNGSGIDGKIKAYELEVDIITAPDKSVFSSGTYCDLFTLQEVIDEKADERISIGKIKHITFYIK